MINRINRVLSLVTVFCLVFTLVGCEAFVRKFTRKKKRDVSQDQMVLAPEEYKGPGLSKEALYRQYFMFWKTWHEELVEALLQRKSQKKELDCIKQVLRNLDNVRTVLNAEKQKSLDVYINRLKRLNQEIKDDLYNNNSVNNRYSAERIKRDILRDFSYPKVKDSLVEYKYN
ncbi:MAG: hypothetical protein PHO70_04210 [Candidatus Omnitrophica bacterium]|nr:hypothetical protein [Candidatus Omnitrophota bacterium]